MDYSSLNLSPLQSEILGALKIQNLTATDLIGKVSANINELNSALSELELLNTIVEQNGSYKINS